MSSLNTFVCNKCGSSVSGYSKMKPLGKRPLIDKLFGIRREIEYEYNENFHNTPCTMCNSGTYLIDPKATVFFHDKEPEKLLTKKKLPIFTTKRIDYKCTQCWYKIHGNQSLYRNVKGILSSFFFRGLLAKYGEPLFAINQNFQGLECPMCKTGLFIEYERNTTKEKTKGITLPNDNDTAKKIFARDLVHHLEVVGQIPRTYPEKLEKHLTEKFPLAKD